MTSARVALAEHILYEHFGAAVGIVGGTLLARGRLSYETLLRLLPRSTFTQATAQASLLVLVQHNCLYYVFEEDEGTEYYEMDLAAVLQRRRFGLFMAITREQWGKRALEVVQRVLVEGKIKLETLLEDCAPLGDERQNIKAIYELLDAGVLQPVMLSDQTSKEDQDLQLEKQMLRGVKGPPTPKDIKTIRETIEAQREALNAEERKWGKDHITFAATCLETGEHEARDDYAMDHERGQAGSNKRRGPGGSPRSPPKSQRLALPFDSQTYVRVHHEAFDVRIRNDIITRSVRNQKGGAAGVLVQTILNESAKGEYKLDREESSFIDAHKMVASSNRRSPSRQTVPLPEVNGYGQEQHAFYSVFPADNVEATMGIEPSGTWSAKDKQPVDLVNEVLHNLLGETDARPRYTMLEVPDQLQAKLDKAYTRENSWLITDDAIGKASHRMRSYRRYAVDYHNAGEIIKVGLLENFVLQQHGKNARRVWKAVDEKGKMDEKHIAKLVMLPAKDVREVIATLSSAGLLLQQEVPRTVDRNPSRAFFLFYVSRSACAQLLAGHLYEALVNICVRREQERDNSKALLRRSERSDVRENITLLDQTDRQELGDLAWRLESLGYAQERIDRDLFVLETMPAIER